MPSIVCLSLLASAFGILLAKALYLRGENPLDIFVFAYNGANGGYHKPSEAQLSDYVTSILEKPHTDAAVFAMFQHLAKGRDSEPLHGATLALRLVSALYYDCGASSKMYQWPGVVTTLSCDTSTNDKRWGKDTLIFVGLHQNTDFSVDLPEGIKLLLRAYRKTGGTVVFVSDGAPKNGLNNRDMTGQRWRTNSRFHPTQDNSVTLHSMLPSIPPRGNRTMVQPDAKTFGGVESILYQVRQVLRSPPRPPPPNTRQPSPRKK